jgi:hypothetical protein
MNWEATGAIAELLGAIGVIASLIYLATQMRQNTRATRASTYQQFSDSLNGIMMAAGENPQREQAVLLGMADFSQLSEEDAFRFIYWITGVTHAFDNAHYQYRVGMLDEDRWQKHYADVRSIFQIPGVAQWWRVGPPNVSPEFRALVEEILGDESGRADP